MGLLGRSIPEWQGAFIAGEAYQASGDWANMEDDFGFVCFPKGPAADDYTTSAATTCM